MFRVAGIIVFVGIVLMALENVSALQCYSNFKHHFSRPSVTLDKTRTFNCTTSCYTASIGISMHGCANLFDIMPQHTTPGVNYRACMSDKCNKEKTWKQEHFQCYQFIEASIPSVWTNHTQKDSVDCSSHCYVISSLDKAYGCTDDLQKVLNISSIESLKPDPSVFKICKTDKCNGN